MIVKFLFIKVKLSFVLVCCYGFWYSLFYNLLYCLCCFVFFVLFVCYDFVVDYVIIYKVKQIPSFCFDRFKIYCIVGGAVCKKTGLP